MSHIDISGWGNTPPQWIQQLASAVADTSRAAVARRMDVSRTSVSLLLKNDYPSPSTQKMQAKVEVLLSAVECPVLGEIPNEQCQKERKKPFIGSNPIRIQLYRACRSCPNNPVCQESRHD